MPVTDVQKDFDAFTMTMTAELWLMRFAKLNDWVKVSGRSTANTSATSLARTSRPLTR